VKLVSSKLVLALVMMWQLMTEMMMMLMMSMMMTTMTTMTLDQVTADTDVPLVVMQLV